MKRCVLLTALLLCCAVVAQAGTYTISLPSLAATYGDSNPNASNPPPLSRTCSINFGHTFASIQSVSISWSGQNYDGYSMDMFTYETYPRKGYFGAYLQDGSTTHKEAGGGGQGVYGSFSDTTSFAPYNGYISWDFLLDGTANLNMHYVRANLIIPELITISNCYGSLDSVSLTLEGTVVPEPSAIAGLLTGLVALGGFMRRRGTL
jgi:hypothetical protein